MSNPNAVEPDFETGQWVEVSAADWQWGEITEIREGRLGRPEYRVDYLKEGHDWITSDQIRALTNNELREYCYRKALYQAKETIQLFLRGVRVQVHGEVTLNLIDDTLNGKSRKAA
jgi:hypothetical protein